MVWQFFVSLGSSFVLLVYCWICSHKDFYFCFHRDIYYNNTQLFGSQNTVDHIVDDISCMLKVPRRSLHVVSAGLMSILQRDCGKRNTLQMLKRYRKVPLDMFCYYYSLLV